MTDKPQVKPGEWIKNNHKGSDGQSEESSDSDKSRQDKATWNGEEWNNSETEEGGYAEKQP